MSDCRKWIVTIREEIIREYRCENCTEEQARSGPWDHCVGESIELECIETTILSVEPSE